MFVRTPGIASKVTDAVLNWFFKKADRLPAAFDGKVEEIIRKSPGCDNIQIDELEKKSSEGKCPICGENLGSDAWWCKNCGFSLDAYKSAPNERKIELLRVAEWTYKRKELERMELGLKNSWFSVGFWTFGLLLVVNNFVCNIVVEQGHGGIISKLLWTREVFTVIQYIMVITIGSSAVSKNGLRGFKRLFWGAVLGMLTAVILKGGYTGVVQGAGHSCY